MAEVGDIPEEVFRMAAIAVDPIDPDGTQRNLPFRQAVAAGWISGRGTTVSEWALWVARQLDDGGGDDDAEPAESPDHDSVYLDIHDGLLTMTQTTGRTLSVMVNGAYIAVPDRTRSTINYGPRSSIEYGSREGAGDA